MVSNEVCGCQFLTIPTVCKYQLDVYTGDARGAGTDANVYVEVFGKRGDTGRRRLRKSINNSNKFEQGKVSVRKHNQLGSKVL